MANNADQDWIEKVESLLEDSDAGFFVVISSAGGGGGSYYFLCTGEGQLGDLVESLDEGTRLIACRPLPMFRFISTGKLPEGFTFEREGTENGYLVLSTAEPVGMGYGGYKRYGVEEIEEDLVDMVGETVTLCLHPSRGGEGEFSIAYVGGVVGAY